MDVIRTVSTANDIVVQLEFNYSDRRFLCRTVCSLRAFNCSAIHAPSYWNSTNYMRALIELHCLLNTTVYTISHMRTYCT